MTYLSIWHANFFYSQNLYKCEWETLCKLLLSFKIKTNKLKAQSRNRQSHSWRHIAPQQGCDFLWLRIRNSEKYSRN
jgi:hypothetical protein